MLEDVVRGEAAEKELNAFIERRALKMNPEQRRVEDAWEESVRAHNERVRRDNRAAWCAYHEDQAERIERTARALAYRHRERARALLENERMGA